MLTTHPLLSAEVYKERRAIPLLSLRACAAYNRVKPYLTKYVLIKFMVFLFVIGCLSLRLNIDSADMYHILDRTARILELGSFICLLTICVLKGVKPDGRGVK